MKFFSHMSNFFFCSTFFSVEVVYKTDLSNYSEHVLKYNSKIEASKDLDQ